MRITAYWAEPTEGDSGNGGVREISGDADIDELLKAISAPLAEEAILYHDGRSYEEDPIRPGDMVPDHEVSIAVRDHWAYMRIWTSDDDERWILDGDPASAAFVQGESTFPAGSGVTVAQVADALKEFLATARRPEFAVKWTVDS